MLHRLSRRGFTSNVSGLGALGLTASPAVVFAQSSVPSVASLQPPEWWPAQDPALAKEMVSVAHRDVTRVRELVERYPALANASVDWGYGDWEDALGAAAHTGRREIAEVLLAHGARISIFAAAMLGYIDVVKAFVAASPGIQRTLGPHGIPLLAHARAGGSGAQAVVEYLETVGDAGSRSPSQPLDNADRNAMTGRYEFGAGPRDFLDIDVVNDLLGITRPGTSRRLLTHIGGLVFFPSGAPAVKIAFARANGKFTQLTVADSAIFLTAKQR